MRRDEQGGTSPDHVLAVPVLKAPGFVALEDEQTVDRCSPSDKLVANGINGDVSLAIVGTIS